LKQERLQQSFSRQDAKAAKVRSFAQSGEDDWAKPKGFKGDMFCLSSSPDKQKVNSLRPLRLCGDILKGISFCVNLRVSAVKFLCLGSEFVNRG